jgi:hypothetical protein
MPTVRLLQNLARTMHSVTVELPVVASCDPDVMPGCTEYRRGLAGVGAAQHMQMLL